MPFSEHLLTHLHNAVHDDCGFDLTPEQVQEVVQDRHVQSALILGGVDTVARGIIANFLAMKILGRRWPTYGEGEAVYLTFEAALDTKARELGYRVV